MVISRRLRALHIRKKCKGSEQKKLAKLVMGKGTIILKIFSIAKKKSLNLNLQKVAKPNFLNLL